MNLKAAPARLSTASATFEAEFKARLHWSAEADAAIEQVVADILADAIVDLVSTGNTLKANHLVEVERIMDISARLVVNQAALKLKREPIRRIIDAFASAIPPAK